MSYNPKLTKEQKATAKMVEARAKVEAATPDASRPQPIPPGPTRAALVSSAFNQSDDLLRLVLPHMERAGGGSSEAWDLARRIRAQLIRNKSFRET